MINEDLKTQYLLMLPLPLTKPGAHARLFGVVYMYLDARLNLVGKKEILFCKQAPYALPSPMYMYQLGIDPSSINNALTELEFYNKIEKLFNKDTILITFSFKYLESLNAIGMRVFKNQNIFRNLKTLIDLKLAINTSKLFSELISDKNDLLAIANDLGLKEEIKRYEHFKRLDALLFIFKYLLQNEGKIINYLGTDVLNLNNNLVHACQNQSIYLYLNEKGDFYFIKCLECCDFQLKALLYKKNQCHLVLISLFKFELLCPISVLTKARQEKLNLNLNQVLADLPNIKVQEDKLYYLSYFDKYFAQLPSYDRIFYHEFEDKDPRALNMAPIHLSAKTRQLHFLFKAENLYGSMLDYEISEYRSWCMKELEKHILSYIKESQALVNLIGNNEDEYDLQMLNKIQQYPLSL